MKQDLDLAQKSAFFGLKEIGVNEEHEHVLAYKNLVGVGKDNWSTAFMFFCLNLAEEKIQRKSVLKKVKTAEELLEQAKGLGLILEKPIRYCIGVMRIGGEPKQTFRVLSVDETAGLVYTLDGNWSNSVCKSVHPIADCDFIALA